MSVILFRSLGYWIKFALCCAVLIAFVAIELASPDLYGITRLISVAVAVASPFALIYLLVLARQK